MAATAIPITTHWPASGAASAREFEALSLRVLQIARANRPSRFGTVSPDGTKIHANASRHSALPYAHAGKIEAQLKQEVQELLALADTGYFSEHNVKACLDAEIEPLVVPGRDDHHPHWKERFSEPEALPEGATPVEKMKHTLRARAGRRPQRMDAGLPGVEFETHGRVAPELRPQRVNGAKTD